MNTEELNNLSREELLQLVLQQKNQINQLKRAEDNKFFQGLSSKKQKQREQLRRKIQYRNNIKANALTERQFLNDIPIDIYSDTKTEARKAYEKRLKQVKNQTQYKKELAHFMKLASNDTSFQADIGDDEDKRLAFTEMLRHSYNKKKVVVVAYTLDGKKKWFTLSDKHNIESTIGHISGELDLTEDQSDSNPYISSHFIPVKYDIMIINKQKDRRGVRFEIQREDEDTHKTFTEEVELDEDYRMSPEGSFFPFINLSSLDLTEFQIFNNVNKNNYKDNCFVYACIQSNVFTKEEINHLRFYVQTRSIPNNKITEIAQEFKCNFVVKRINENFDVKHQQQIKIDTRKKPWAKDFKRTVELLLFKDHYMIYKNIQCTVYYLEHAAELDREYPKDPRRFLITGIHQSQPNYSKNGCLPMLILRKMFELNMFREIKSCELNVLATMEYDCLNDYTDLSYDEALCTKPLESAKEEKEWSRIYYSDFETDTSISPHKPYLNCTVYRDGPNIHKIQFTGVNIGGQMLDYLQNGSLTYFHNLKYDSCFFINTPGWNTQITERSGTVLQVVMLKYIKNNKKVSKQLTFRNSYSIIPAALRNFATMFNLNVHKEVMAYKLYTEDNIKRKILPIEEFNEQYRKENEGKDASKQILENAKLADAYSNENNTIDIMKYAVFYCFKDCIVLMKGLEKFNCDLKEVFKQTKTKMLNVHNYISISSIGYHFACQFGCFDGCYLLSGKPQNFIQRCVSGGRTMTANNEKQYIEGRIQDFDAVSLYPSAMYVMSGVPKGKPKIIQKDEDIMKYDTFFIEINITDIQCKSKAPYKFGQVFKRNDKGSKIFVNEPVSSFYIDKVGLVDLLEFYDIKYELIRGYYFDEGFNSKINTFIEGLFNLRLKYKKAKNPLQNTIKLLLNSIYGKSILKAMKTETKSVPRDKILKYIWRNYNYITQIYDDPTIEKLYVKKLKPINKHFNLPQFGAGVLSWSKHLMNRVMNTAEQNGIPIFYQDTDSMHLFEKDVPKVAEIFKVKYNAELIGEKMCQFHNDFDGFEGAVGAIHSRKLIALGKKSYLDILVDEKGNEGYHIRLKGIPHQVIINKCKRMGITIEELYERLYQGQTMTFDLLDGTNAFRKTQTFQQTNLPAFTRTVKFT